MARNVNVRLPDGISDDDFKVALTKGVPPELTALLDSVRGLLGALDQSVRTMSESSRLAAETQAKAIRESSTTLDVSDVAARLESLTAGLKASNDSVKTSLDRVASVIAESVKIASRPADNSIVDAIAPLLAKEAPRVRRLNVERGDDDYIQSITPVYEREH